MLAENGHAEVRDELITVMLCEHFKWTYEELTQQPWWLAEIYKIKLKVDREKQDKQVKQNKTWQTKT